MSLWHLAPECRESIEREREKRGRVHSSTRAPEAKMYADSLACARACVEKLRVLSNIYIGKAARSGLAHACT